MSINMRKTVRPLRYCPSCGGTAQHRPPPAGFLGELILEILPYALLVIGGLAIGLLGHVFGFIVGFFLCLFFMYKFFYWHEAYETCECSQCGLQIPRCQFQKEKPHAKN